MVLQAELEVSSCDLIGLCTNKVLDQLTHFNVLQFVLLCELSGMIRLATPRGSHQQNARWAPWALGAGQLQYTHDLLKDDALGTVAVELHDLPLASLFDSLDLKAILSQSILSNVVDVFLLEIDNLILTLQVPLDLIHRDVLNNVQHYELVRDDPHLLQCDCLQTGSREALYDPRAGLLFLLELLNLQLHELDDDLVADVRVGLPRLDYLLAEFRLLLDLLPQEVTHGDALERVLPLFREIFTKRQGNFLALAPGWANDYKAFRYKSKVL